MQAKHTMPNQARPKFDPLISDAMQPLRRAETIELDSADRQIKEIMDTFTRLLKVSSTFDNLVVFEKPKQGAAQPQLKQFDTLPQAL